MLSAWLLIGWAEVGPGLVQAISASRDGAAERATRERPQGGPAARTNRG
jgi:hypothetical protein